MKSPRFVFPILSLFVLAGCGSALRSRTDSAETATAGQSRGFVYDSSDKKIEAGDQNPAPAQISLQQANQSQSIAEAMDRKIIRDAELMLEVGAPAEVQRKITTVAEMLGGFLSLQSQQQQVSGAR